MIPLHRRSGQGSALPPGTLPPGASGGPRETLAGALAAAEQVPAPEGTALADAAREAFTQSFAVAEGIGVALLLGAAGAFAVLVRADRSADLGGRRAAGRSTE